LRNLRSTRTQRGFTLTELMIAIALGMSVISSVLLGYLATYSGSVSTLANSKLRQEMSALMNLMVEDIRRAGYNADLLLSPANNVFNVRPNTTLEVFPTMASINPGAETGSGSCIVYAYDRFENGIVDDGTLNPPELFGFRLNGTVVEMRTDGDPANAPSCSGVGEWTALTDNSFIEVTDLGFSLATSSCLNTREPNAFDDDNDLTDDNAEEADCYLAPLPVANSGDITVETRQVDITLTANLANDPFVNLTIEQTVRVRNDLVRVF
jgi:prepilin peptidase dependent protein B